MEKTLKEINALAGVNSSFICDNLGQLLGETAGSEFDDKAMKKIGLQMLQTMAALEKADLPSNELDFKFAANRILVRDLPAALLVVICRPQVDIALLRMALNVAVSSLKDSADLQKEVAKANAQREIVKDEVDSASWNLQKSFVSQ